MHRKILQELSQECPSCIMYTAASRQCPAVACAELVSGSCNVLLQCVVAKHPHSLNSACVGGMHATLSSCSASHLRVYMLHTCTHIVHTHSCIHMVQTKHSHTGEPLRYIWCAHTQVHIYGAYTLTKMWCTKHSHTSEPLRYTHKAHTHLHTHSEHSTATQVSHSDTYIRRTHTCTHTW